MVKNLPVNAGDTRDMSLIPGSGRSPGGENGNPLQYSCLENSMDRGTWQVTVPGVTKESELTELHSANILEAVLQLRLGRRETEGCSDVTSTMAAEP